MPQPPEIAAAPTPRAEARSKQAWWTSLPNWLTASRVLLAVIFFALLSWYRHTSPEAAPAPLPGRLLARPDWYLIGASVVFVVAALTDALDGHLARKWNLVSVFGRVMDPFADKLLVVGAFVFLAGPGFTAHPPDRPPEQVSGVYPWMVAVILGRELLVTSIRGVFEGQGVAFAASSSGKWKMILQSFCVPAVLLVIAFANPLTPSGTFWGLGSGGRPSDPVWGRMIIDSLVWLTVVITAWSGMPYVLRATSALRRGEIKES